MRRDCLLFVRVSAFERDLVARAAGEQHVSVAEYIRTVLREAIRGPIVQSTANTARTSDAAGA
jgi:hypothetical protein